MAQQSKFWKGFDDAFKAGRYLKPQTEVNALSVASVMLEMSFGQQLLAKGTGWFWRQTDGIALVTAWHNLSGLHHTERTALSRSGGMPDRVKFRYMTRKPKTFQEGEVPLYLDADRTRPRWFVHPECGSFFDLAYIGLNISGAEVGCVNDSIGLFDGTARAGEDVFAVGFPQGIGTLGLFAVWKRGSIATDPDVMVGGHPKFYIDIAGRGGLSGAPVYRAERGFVLEERGSGQQARLGEKLQLIGLYSGRAADQMSIETRTGESSDLGFVWRAEVVSELLAGGVLDEQPEPGKGQVKMTEIWEPPSSST